MPTYRDWIPLSTFPISSTGDFLAVDRTGTIRMPIKTKSFFPLPTMRSFSKTFEEICNERAVELFEAC